MSLKLSLFSFLYLTLNLSNPSKLSSSFHITLVNPYISLFQYSATINYHQSPNNPNFLNNKSKLSFLVKLTFVIESILYLLMLTLYIKGRLTYLNSNLSPLLLSTLIYTPYLSQLHSIPLTYLNSNLSPLLISTLIYPPYFSQL